MPAWYGDPYHPIAVRRLDKERPLRTDDSPCHSGIRSRRWSVLDSNMVVEHDSLAVSRSLTGTAVRRCAHSAGGADLAAEMLGHTSAQITKQHYIEPDETVNPVTAEILESLAARNRREAHDQRG